MNSINALVIINMMDKIVGRQLDPRTYCRVDDLVFHPVFSVAVVAERDMIQDQVYIDEVR